MNKITEINEDKDHPFLNRDQMASLYDIFINTIEDQKKRGNDITNGLIKLLGQIENINNKAKKIRGLSHD